MMTKEQHIAHWLSTSEEDEITMDGLFEIGRYTHSLFFGHLYIEKICKALWVKNNNGKMPPATDNLVTLLPKINLGLSEEDFSFLDKLNEYYLNEYQLAGTSPESSLELNRQTTKEYTANCINHIKTISECLQKNIDNGK